MPRIALIHAVTVAMQPVENAFARLWPEAERANLLDDALSPDRAKSSELTPKVSARIQALAGYAVDQLGADGVLFTCSAFGPAIEAAARRTSRPVLKPNEAMFEAALQHGTRIGMLATFQPAVESMELEFRELLAARNMKAELRTICVPEAMSALSKGDVATHNRLVAERAVELADSDVILLAHFSTSRAEDAVKGQFGGPVLTSPGSAVLKLKKALTAQAAP